MSNITKQLIDEFGVAIPSIMLKCKCSDEAVKNWYRGVNLPMPIYQERLEKLLAQKQKAADAKAAL